jgi:hypothetical protein
MKEKLQIANEYQTLKNEFEKAKKVYLKNKDSHSLDTYHRVQK